ncbi:MAG: 2-hydroxyacid dehydrogenase, partial [Firmicutes bacterium]|nr:2-hydroxyacid dehydrogenase [Bacillota bacterium]
SLSGLTGFDMKGKTVGVIGTGQIGRTFIDICRGFQMEVLAYDPHPLKDSALRYVNLETLYQGSQILSLHCPLTKDTYHLINAEAIGEMRNGVLLINTSRGAIIDSEALLHGLRSKKIGGAALDVYEEESELFFEDFSQEIVSDDTLSLLISLPNVIVTSHQAFLTEEALKSIAETTIGNLCAFFSGDALPNEVCYQCGAGTGGVNCAAKKNGRCF